MTLGDNIAHPLTGDTRTDAERHRQLVEQSVWAADAGFDAVHIGEHHFNDYMLSSPPVVLAAIGERAPNLILSTAVTLVPTLDPVRCAEDYATLDALSGGRVEIVTGRGNIYAKTFPAFGLDVADARAIYDERLELLQRLLNEEQVSWEGETRSPITDLTVRPRPTRNIPIWVGAGSAGSADLAARLGCALMLPSVFGPPSNFLPVVDRYRESWAAAGRDEADIVIGACCHTYAGSDRDDMLQRFAPRYRHYWEFVNELISWHTGGTVDMSFDLDSFLAGPAVAGSSQECIDRMGEIHDLFGHQRQLFMFDMGGVSDGELRETIDRFGAEVIPHLPGDDE